MANGIEQEALADMRAAFKKQGITLLTPEQFLNTEAKRKYYYSQFTPEMSKLGNFLSKIENKQTDISVAADTYRCFDIAAAADHLRSQSYGADLAKKLGVDGVLSIAIELQSDNKNVNIHGVKMALHGPNTIPREDKNYVAQKMGNGYYDGQIYSYLTYYFPKPIKVGSFDKKKIEGEKKKVVVMEGMDFKGMDIVLSSMIEKMGDVMNESVEKAGKKYNK